MTLATAKYRMTPELYRRQFAEWTRYVSRWRKRVVHISCATSAVGILLMLFTAQSAPSLFLFSALLAVLGPITYFEHLLDRRKWLKRAYDSRVTGEEIEIRFEEDAIYMQGPTSNSRTEWHGFERAVAAANGLFLYTDKGVHVYVPDYALEPAGAKSVIIARLGVGQ